MDRSRVVGTAVATIVVLTLATGPYVGLLTVPDSGATDSLGDGNATVDVISVPETATLEYGRYGNDEYHLRIPDAEVRVTNLTGNPILNYNVDIDALGYSSSSIHLIGEAGTGRRTLSFDTRAFAAGEIERESYEARLSLVLRANGTERVIYDEPATIEVQR